VKSLGNAPEANTWEGYRLSHQQERLWSFQHTRGIERTVAGAVLEGPLNLEVLAATLADLVERYEILRTSFKPVLGGDSAALMVIAAASAPKLTEVDLIGIEPDEQARTITDYVCVEQERPFDATAPTPIQFILFTQGVEQHTFVILAPRLCLDRPSTTNLFEKLAAAYTARVRGLALPESHTIQYADFAQWQLDRDASSTMGGTLAERSDASCASQPLRLPLEFAGRGEGWATLRWTAPTGTLVRMARLAQQHCTSLHVILQACWNAALWRVGRQFDRVEIETNFPCRPFEELADAIGCFESYGSIALDISVESTLDLLIQSLAGKLRLVDQNSLPLGSERDRLHELHRVGFTHTERPSRISAGPLTLTEIWSDTQTEPFKLELISEAAGDNLRLALRYEKLGFAHAGIEAVVHAVNAVLGAAVATPTVRIEKLALLDEDTAAQLIERWNSSATPLTRPICWHRAFSEQAVRTPGVLAVSCADRLWTYAELDHFTNRMARALRKRGVVRGSVVALLLERSDLAIAALIAVLKAGGTYIPLDPGLPIHRRAAIIMQTVPTLLIADDAGACEQNTKLPYVLIDADRAAIDGEDDSPLVDVTEGDDLVYVLFTSGSTGTPKGVAIEHQQLMHYVDGAIERLGLNEPARYVALSTLTTDLGNTTIFTALCTGGSLDVIPVSLALDAQALTAYLANRPYDILKITPSHLAALFAVTDAPESLLPRRSLILGGEALSWGMLRVFQSFAGSCRIFNHYGPTETCVGVLAGEVVSDVNQDLASTVPLGRPLRHARAYVLDSWGQPVPLGVAGELWIGGETVARGYFHSPVEGVKRFMADPWTSRSGARMFRSGDLIRQLPDGEFEFLGRIDRQVKLRGFRIELGEIEAVLRQHENVTASLVIEAGESGDVHLVAYVVTSDASTGAAEWLRLHLRDRLPDFMIPTHFVALARFPLTAAGKIDASMLPNPDTVRASTAPPLVQPRTETERSVAAIFSELLFVEQVGIEDDFFEIGGHSLLATRLLSRLRTAFSVELSLRGVFENATVEGLSATIDVKMAQRAKL